MVGLKQSVQNLSRMKTDLPEQEGILPTDSSDAECCSFLGCQPVAHPGVKEGILVGAGHWGVDDFEINRVRLPQLQVMDPEGWVQRGKRSKA